MKSAGTPAAVMTARMRLAKRSEDKPHRPDRTCTISLCDTTPLGGGVTKRRPLRGGVRNDAYVGVVFEKSNKRPIKELESTRLLA